MNSKRIAHILNMDPRSSISFQGFGNPDFPLPIVKRYPAVFILNTAPFLSSGEHWCVVCMESKGSCYFFDSFGQHPQVYGLDVVLKDKCANLRFNKRIVQSENSKTCGHHCIYFIKHFCYGMHPELIMDSYSDSTRKNDNLVYDYVRRQCGDSFAVARM
jgi:Adenovirus endoprotease